MRRAPKFELTEDMIVDNIRTVAARLGVERLSQRQYDQHGSFSIRTFSRRGWTWRSLATQAGIQVGLHGRLKAVRVPCRFACGRMAREHRTTCKTCRERLIRQSRGMVA